MTITARPDDLSLSAAPVCAPPAVDKAAFREAMAALGAAVSIITTDGPGGQAGFTASAVCSVTDTPPTLLVCINRSASAYCAFADNGVMCVNTLSHDQEALSNLFGGRTPMAGRFAAAQWNRLVTGAPVLEGAAVSFDCRVTQSVDVGTHRVLFGAVEAIRHGAAAGGLIYFDRRYHALPRRA
ncbi:NADH-dependent FMN reductase RutF [Pseudoxanthobacter sp.]|uniref:NADH-dependent FMN reductase RutF n=1 Tax=Pseudoxanthobacter sp. TaxID=1925742 RepID=UPI002FE19569